MKNFHRTYTNKGIIVKRKWQLIVTSSVVLLILESLLTLPAKGFNPKDLDKVLSGKDCVGCDLSGANLYAKDLRNAVLCHSNLSNAKLGFANLKNADLSGANLRGAELFSSFLFGANLSKANLQGTVLMGSYLHQANLERANLSRTDLSRAFLFDANLRGSDLNGANLEGTTLIGANLSATNLSKAILNETLYDPSTLFPNGFNLKTAGLIASRPSPGKPKETDRYNAQLAELHQLSFARMILGMGAYDQHSYGGCRDLSCFDPLIIVNERLLKLTGEVFGEQSPQVVSELSALATLYQDREKYDKAESFYLQALDLVEKQHNLFDTTRNLRGLARIYCLQGRYNEAVSLLERALKIFESSELEAELKAKYKQDFLEMTTTMPELARIPRISEQDLAKMVEKEKTDGIVQVLYELADVYLSGKKYAEAESFYKRSLDLQKNSSDGSMNLTLLKLAWVHHAQGHRTEAEALYQQILKSYKEIFPDGSLPPPILIEVNSIQENLNRLQKSLPPVIDIK